MGSDEETIAESSLSCAVSACGGKNMRVPVAHVDPRRNLNREFAKNNNRMRDEA
jgi:hypothetical protein